MDLLLGSSLIAAFIAGVAALFAPCCITVLLPAYLGSIFRERYKIFLMTFIFFLGILTVFLPLGLGASALAQLFSEYHNAIFSVAGAMLSLLGLSLLLGKRFSLPFEVTPSLKNHHAFSVFFLGILSAIATTCCAPVLAGVLALTVLPGSILWGGIYTLSYVLGMVMPLFIIALFLDKVDFTKKFMLFRKSFEYSLFGRKIRITFAEVISGLTFLAMGVFILYLAVQNRLFAHSEYQTQINIYLTKLLSAISEFIKTIPEYIWGILIVALTITIIKLAINMFKKERI